MPLPRVPLSLTFVPAEKRARNEDDDGDDDEEAGDENAEAEEKEEEEEDGKEERGPPDADGVVPEGTDVDRRPEARPTEPQPRPREASSAPSGAYPHVIPPALSDLRHAGVATPEYGARIRGMLHDLMVAQIVAMSIAVDRVSAEWYASHPNELYLDPRRPDPRVLRAWIGRHVELMPLNEYETWRPPQDLPPQLQPWKRPRR